MLTAVERTKKEMQKMLKAVEDKKKQEEKQKEKQKMENKLNHGGIHGYLVGSKELREAIQCTSTHSHYYRFLEKINRTSYRGSIRASRKVV